MIYVPSFSTGFRSVSSVRAQIYETASFESLSSDGEQGLLCFTGFCCVSIFFIFKYHFRRHVARRSRRRPSMTSCSMARVFPVSYVTRIRHQIYPPPPPCPLAPPPPPYQLVPFFYYHFFPLYFCITASALLDLVEVFTEFVRYRVPYGIWLRIGNGFVDSSTKRKGFEENTVPFFLNYHFFHLYWLLHYSISSRFLPDLFDIESRMGYRFGLGMDSSTKRKDFEENRPLFSVSIKKVRAAEKNGNGNVVNSEPAMQTRSNRGNGAFALANGDFQSGWPVQVGAPRAPADSCAATTTNHRN